MIPTQSTFLFLLLPVILYKMHLSSSSSLGPSIHQLTRPVDHGEGPTWDERTGLLYFVSITEGKVLSYNLSNKETNFVEFNGNVTPVVQSNDPQRFVIGLNRSLVTFKWDGKNKISEQKTVATVADQFPKSRFNDGKADKKGRLWFGTIGYENASYLAPNEGLLFMFNKNNIKNPKVQLVPVTVSNGLVWNKANNKFFYIDSPTKKIMEYDYDEEAGDIKNGKVAFDISNLVGEAGIVPDGMTIDVDDNLWVALYGGGSVIQVDPSKNKLLKRIAIPATYVTSVMFGGPKFDVLFVTTSRLKLSELERQQQPAAGSLFAITDLKTHGLPVFNADI